MLPLFLKVPAAQAALDMKTVPLILYAGIFSSVLLSFLWIEGVHRLGPNRCSIFINLLPLFTAMPALVWRPQGLSSPARYRRRPRRAACGRPARRSRHGPARAQWRSFAGSAMSIFQKAAIALARSPAPAASCGPPPTARWPAAVGGATTSRRRRPRACAAARHPRLAVLSGCVADPSSNRPSSRPSPPPRAGGGPDVHVSIPPPSATRTRRWAATMRAHRVGARRRRAARLGGAGHGGRRHPQRPPASGTAGRRLAGGPDATGAAPAPAGPGVGGAPAHLAAPGQGAFRCARWTIAARRYLEAAAIMLSPQARGRFSCRCSAP